MKRSEIKLMPEYFSKYIFYVEDIELDDAFQNNINTVAELDVDKLILLGDNVYAPGKWTVKDIFQHLVDTERVMGYRTLRFARRDGVVPQGYDQDLFVANGDAGHRALAQIVEEFRLLHHATRFMFRSFSDQTLQATGINWNKEMSVLSMGFLITGHFIHHMKTIKEKYLPLLHDTT